MYIITGRRALPMNKRIHYWTPPIQFVKILRLSFQKKILQIESDLEYLEQIIFLFSALCRASFHFHYFPRKPLYGVGHCIGSFHSVLFCYTISTPFSYGVILNYTEIYESKSLYFIAKSILMIYIKLYKVT